MSDHRSGADEGSASERGARLSVTQVKSTIGTRPIHRKTMKALGLAGIGRTTNLPDNPSVRGMLHNVRHLIAVKPGEELS